MAEMYNISFSALFVDVSTAFATMCREIAECSWEDDQEFIDLCVSKGIDRNIALQFLEYLHSHPLWETFHEKHIHDMLCKMHKHRSKTAGLKDE